MRLIVYILSFLSLSSCGPPGESGFNSLIAMSRGAAACLSGEGVTIISALDINRSGVIELDSDINVEVAFVCDGASVEGPFSNVEVMDPCGDTPGKVDEVLLRLSDGTVLVSFSDNAAGNNTRFALIAPGTYSTTDGTGCTFTLGSDGRLL